MKLEDFSPLDRREFLKGVSLAAAGLALPQALSAAETNSVAAAPAATETKSGVIPKRPLGRTKEMVSILGVGGHTLGTAESEEESIRIVHEAIDAGVNFMDNAWEYNGGRSQEIRRGY